MKLSVIVIGDELLIGQVTDTNSGMIARHIAPYGWEVNDIQTVGDNAPDITRAIDRAFQSSDAVITTGGLGPTKDDITKGVLRDYFGGTMIEDPEVTANVNAIFGRRGIKMNTLTAAQAIVPSSARIIQNRVGTAPIMWFEKDEKVLVSMPGVPFETETMLKEAVFPQLLQHFGSDVTVEHAVVLVTDYTESGLALKLEEWETALPPYLHLAYLPKQGIIRLRIDGVHPDGPFIRQKVAEAHTQLIEMLGDAILSTEDLTPAEILLKECRERGLHFASAESCTGGNIAHQLTLIPGASDVVSGGIVSYSNEVKHNLLGVDTATLEAHGAVSEPVVIQMAEGACRAVGTEVAVATSGIAGPGGGTEEKPVGTVWMAASILTPAGAVTVTKCGHFNGNRARIIDTATNHALMLAIRLIRRNS